MPNDDEFRTAYPALNKELESGTAKVEIDGVRAMSEKTETPSAERFLPDVADYIRRCDTMDQAVEIINYMLKRGEINTKEARKFKSQLKAQGLRSFGTKKETDHYLHFGTSE
ncbi:MAG: DUF2095 family protein [Candidatus Thorarchaeota archaeon]|nr:DUF2095 family protein [Candidatus Thorarchaeota archaeon]